MSGKPSQCQGEEKPYFSLMGRSREPPVGPLRSQDEAGGHQAWKHTHSHLWYLWLFPECPGVGQGLRGDERSLLGVPLQWGSGGATLGEVVPLSQNGRRRWKRNWGRWMLRGGLTGPHRPLEEKGESKTENLKLLFGRTGLPDPLPQQPGYPAGTDVSWPKYWLLLQPLSLMASSVAPNSCFPHC